MQKFLSSRSGREGTAGVGPESQGRSRRFVFGLLAALALGWLAAPLQAQLIHDPFNYAPGVTLAGRSPFAPLTWVAAGPAGPRQARVDPGVLQWPGLSNSVPNRVNIIAGNGPSSEFVFGPGGAYPPITAGTIYFSFILRVTDLAGLGAGGNYFAGFTPDQMGGPVAPANVFTRVLLRTSGAGYNIGLDKSSGVPANFQWDPRVFNVGDTVLIVGAYIFGAENADISQLWINPNPTTFCSTTPPPYTLQSTAGPDATQLASVAYIQRPTPAQPTAMLTDELRVAAFWDGVVRPGWDYPDSPPPYPTLFANNAARHTAVPGIYMGNLIDVECNGIPSVPADGDDLDNLDDEDGVTWAPGPWIIGGNRNITVTVSVNGQIDAFFDWNKDGDWADAGEQVFSSQTVVAGPNPLLVTVPSGLTEGFTYARFRFSTAGGLSYVGPAPDGEVEDYRVPLQAAPPPPPDLGLAVLVSPSPVTDASNVTSAITVTNKGAGAASGVIFSNTLPPGVSFVSATASQGSCSNNPSGLVCSLGTLPPGGAATVSVVGIPDFNQLATLYNIPETQETIDVTNTIAVASAEMDAAPADNLAAVILAIVPQRDFSDAPYSLTYHTLKEHDGARHRIVGPFFGNSPAGHVHRDADPDGIPSINADGDNSSDGNNDERGIRLLDPLALGATMVRIELSAPLGGRVDGFIDWNHNRSWDDPGDQVFVSLLVPAGVSVHTISVPPGAGPGDTYARFRISENGGLSDHGYVNNGEVEDYKFTIIFPPIVAFNGLQHEALGGAQLNVVSNLLSITPTRATGGVKVTLGESDGYAAYFQGLDHLEATNASVQFSAYGHMAGNTNNQLLSSLRIDGQGTNATVSVDFSGLGATGYRAIFHNANGRMEGMRSLPPGALIPVYPCPFGFIRVLTVRFINGRWMLQYECVRIPGAGPQFPDLSDIRVVELVPDVNQYEYLAHEVQVVFSGMPGPVWLNDAVYKSGLLYTASGDALLQVTAGEVTTAPAGSNSTGGLVMHSGVSDLAPDGTVSTLFDEGVLYTARMSVTAPTAPQISNSILWAGSRVQPFGTGVTYNISASLTTVSGTQRNVTTDFSSLGATQVVAEVYQNSNLVGRVTLPGGAIGTITGSNVVAEVGANPSGSAGFVFTFSGTVTFTAAIGPSYAGNALFVRASAEEAGNCGSVMRLSDFEVGGPVLSSIRSTLLFKLERGDAPAAASLLDARNSTGTCLRLGSAWDTETRGYASDDCTGDDTHTDDEDGVYNGSGGTVFNWSKGASAEVSVVLTGTGSWGYIGIWVDWNGTNGFEPDEFMADGLRPVAGTHNFTFEVPPFDGVSSPTLHRAMRVRVSDEVLAPEDASRYSYAGEVEDYMVTVEIDEPFISHAGLTHTALGGAILNTSSNGLQVANLGTTGQDGVRIELGRVDGWRATLIHQLGASNRADGSRIEWTAYGEKNGQTNQPVIVGRLERTQDCVAMYADGGPVGAPAFHLEILSNGVVVARGTVSSGRVAALRAPLRPIGPNAFKIIWQGLYGPNDKTCAGVWYDDDVRWEGQPISQACDTLFDDLDSPGGDITISGADTLLIRPVSMTATVGEFSRVELRGVNSGDFWLQDEGVAQLGAYLQAGDGTTLLAESNRVRFLPDSNGVAHARILAPESTNASGRCLAFNTPGLALATAGSAATFRAGNAAGSFGALTLRRAADGTLAVNSSFTFTGELNRVVVELFNSTSRVARLSLPAGDLGALSGAGRIVTAGAAQGRVPVLSVVFDAPMSFVPAGVAQATGLRAHPDYDHNRVVWGVLDCYDAETFNEQLMEWINQVIIWCPGPTRPRPDELIFGARPRLSWASEAGVDYLVQSWDDLVSGVPTTLQRVSGTGATLAVEDQRPASVTARFYRVVPVQESLWEGLRGMW